MALISFQSDGPYGDNSNRAVLARGQSLQHFGFLQAFN